MYVYDEYDKKLINERVAQFRSQTQRFLDGKLTEEQFLPLRLQNGLYVQRLAPMLRVSVPYGLLNSNQLRRVARLARDFDKGYVHISTRQNIQFNWPKLEQVPDMLAQLAEVEMHAVQSSGNCIRNTTSDQFAGVAPDEHVDPRPYAEIIRQWSTFHPEFAFLPRKFKIAVCGSQEDRAAIHFHDIAVELIGSADGSRRCKIYVGGGLGRTPVIAQVIHDDLAEEDLLTYLEAILRIYNQHGRRDNKYKARIKILVKATGLEKFKAMVEEEWAFIKDSGLKLTQAELKRVKGFFTEPDYQAFDALAAQTALDQQAQDNTEFAHWVNNNTGRHKRPGYATATIALKQTGIAPGDVSDKQLEVIADLADQFSMGEARTTHQQNMVLADVPMQQLFELWQALQEYGLATPKHGTVNDIICCPGGDFCALANAKSIPIAEAIQRRFDDIDYLNDIGELELNISGCMNACSHHHVGHIGILGVDKKGQEFYQVCLGGDSSKTASIGKILGPSFKPEQVPEIIATLLNTYVSKRTDEERFIDTYRRVGIEPFKEAVYA